MWLVCCICIVIYFVDKNGIHIDKNHKSKLIQPQYKILQTIYNDTEFSCLWYIYMLGAVLTVLVCDSSCSSVIVAYCCDKIASAQEIEQEIYIVTWILPPILLGFNELIFDRTENYFLKNKWQLFYDRHINVHEDIY
jgi:hypothetical protein